MIEGAETAWRAALKAKGKEWVRARLRLRPGQPDDVVYDVVFTDPMPTRDFCQRWCAEEDNRLFEISGYTKAIFVTLLILVICCAGAVQKWSEPKPKPPAPYLAPDVGIGTAGWATATELSNGIGDAASRARTAGLANRSFDPSSSNASLPSSCAYMTYATAACGARH